MRVSDETLELWHNRLVTKLSDAEAKSYVVTASLRESNGEIVIALMSLTYSKDNPDWITHFVTDDEFYTLIATLQPCDEDKHPELWQKLFAKRKAEGR